MVYLRRFLLSLSLICSLFTYHFIGLDFKYLYQINTFFLGEYYYLLKRIKSMIRVQPKMFYILSIQYKFEWHFIFYCCTTVQTESTFLSCVHRKHTLYSQRISIQFILFPLVHSYVRRLDSICSSAQHDIEWGTCIANSANGKGNHFQWEMCVFTMARENISISFVLLYNVYIVKRKSSILSQFVCYEGVRRAAKNCLKPNEWG